MRAYILGGLIVGGCSAELRAGSAAHHSFAAEFDANKPITLTGTSRRSSGRIRTCGSTST